MKVQEIVTNKIVEALNSGKVPWVKGWKDRNPFNAESGREYTGVNRLIVPNDPLGYLTFNKLNELGGKIQKGSHGELVSFWAFIENKKAEKVDGKYPTFPMMRYYNVFSVANIEGLPDKFYVKHERTFMTMAELDAIVTKKDISVKHTGNKAFYSLSTDAITMPDKGQFVTELAYHQTLAHELIHWTGKRLDRELTGKKDDPSYALEELVAEIGSAMLLSEFGLEPDIDNTANYCRTWGERIAADQWLVCKAAARAEKAVQYLLGKPDNAD